MTAIRNMTKDQVTARMLEVGAELEKLGKYPSLTRSQEDRFQELKSEFSELEDRRYEIRHAALGALRSLHQGGGATEGGAEGQHAVGSDHRDRSAEPYAAVGVDAFGRIHATRDHARRAIDEAHRNQGLPDHAAEKATELLDRGMPAERSLAARWAATTGDPAYLSAFSKLLADPIRGHLLWEGREQAAFQAVAHVQSEMRSMSLTDANGGFMVPLTLDPAINLTSAGSINPLRRVSRVVQTVSDQWSGITSAGVTAEWKAEAAEAADGSPTMANPNIPVHFGDAFVPYSFEVGMDASNFAAELQKLLLDAADQLQATAYTTGSGTGQPKGFVTALTGTASEINAAADDTFARGDVYALQNALPARFQANARWQASLPIINQMSQFETAAGARLFPELSDGRLLNRPIEENSNMDNSLTTAGAVSNFVLAYGDWSNFVIVDRIGTTLELIPNLVGANNRPTGQRGALLWFRTGSDVVVANAFRMLDVASAA